MTILQLDLTKTPDFILFAATVLFIQCIILYVVIKWSVQSALRESTRQAIITNRLLKEQLKQQGVAKEAIDLAGNVVW
jgi:hypothetical protein